MRMLKLLLMLALGKLMVQVKTLVKMLTVMWLEGRQFRVTLKSQLLAVTCTMEMTMLVMMMS